MGELKIKKRKLGKNCMKGLDHTDYKVWQKGLAKWDDEIEVMEFDVNVIESGSCWRLVHDGEKVSDLFESYGETSSIQTLFAGTEQECLDEIDRLGLEYKSEETD